MTNIYAQYLEENTLEKAPSQNLGKDVFTSENETPGFNVYQEFFKEEERSINNQVKRSLQLVMEKDPDMVGEGLHLANELGLDRNFALDSDEAIKLMREKKRRDRIESLELAKYSPILHRQLTDPTFAALAYDNIDNLQGLEKLFDDFKSIPENISQGWAKGRLQVRRGHIGTEKFLWGNTDEALDDELAEIDERLAAFEADGTGIFEEGFSIFGQYSKTLPRAFVAGGAGAATGAAVGSWTGPGSLITAKGGFILGFMSSLAADSFSIEGGNTYLELRAENFDPTLSRNIAIGVGLTSMALELWGASLFTAPLRKYLAQQTTKQVVKQLAKPSGKAALTQYLTTWAKGSTQESLTEAAQTLSQILGREIAVLYDDREDINSRFTTLEGIRGVAAELAMTFYRSMQGMVLVGGLTGAPTFISDAKKSQNAKKEEAFFNELENKVNTSKLKERSQEEFQNVTQTMGDEKGVREIYVDSNAFTNSMRQAGITIEDVEQVSPMVAEQLKELEKSGTISGGDVVIPIGEYSAKLVGTDFDNILKQHRRLDKEDSFSREENTYYEANKEKLEKEANEILTKTQSKNKEFKDSAAKVKKDFGNMVRASMSHLAKPYTKKDIRYISSFYQAYVVTQANKLGILPTEFAKRFPYRVVGTDQVQISPEEQLFSQDGTVKTDSAAFKNWFGKSIFKDEKGNPRVLYHGTKDSFNEFKLDHPNRKDYGWLGRAVYLNDGDKAADWAKANALNKKGGKDSLQVMPLYVRLENPYYAKAEEKNANRLGGENAAKGFQDRLIAEGYDGVILKDERPGFADEVAVFDPAAVKSPSNDGTWSREIANIYKQQEQELLEQRGRQKRGKPVPQAVHQIASLVETFNFAKGKPFGKMRDFKLEIQKRVNDEAKKARVDLSENTVERDKYLVQTVLADARYALSENDNAIGWYDTTLTKAKAILSQIHPELATDPESNFAFVYALANTSNMIKVDKNLELAEQAYKYWKENGEFPTEIGIGDAAQAIDRNFKMYNRLIKEKGFAELEEYMKTMHTVKEIETYTGDEVSGLNKTDMAYGAAVMGPKIGNGFFANLYGNYEQLTMDRWLIRTWGRMTGTLVIDYRKQAKVKRGQLKQLIKALSLKDKKRLEAIINTKIRLSDLDGAAVAIQRASTKKSNRTLMNEIATVVEEPERKQFLLDLLGKPQKRYPQVSIGGEIRKGGNALAKYNDGQKETPSGAPERRNITNVFTQVLSTLQQEQPDLTMADLQALLWYPEKRLYDSAKLDADELVRGYEADEAPDYANASVNLARQLGVAEADIQTTLEEVTNVLERKATERTADRKRGEGGDGGVRETGIKTDESTGLPLNPDGTVTVYHHTDRKSASRIESTGELRSAGEPDVYVSTRAIADTGYGDTAVAIRVEPSRLSLDDEFPDGRRDFRLSVGKPGGSVRVKVGEYSQQPEVFRQSGDGTSPEIDTRGKGEFYHGSATEIELFEGGEFSTDQNIYGPGFYATDDLVTAGKYQKKNRKSDKPKLSDYTWKENPEEAYQADLAAWEQSRKPTIYKVTEKKPVKFYDLDQPISDDLKEFIKNYDDEFANEIVYLSDDELGDNYTLAQLYDEIREQANANEVTASTVTFEIFPDFEDFLKEKGFGGFTHQGGKLAGKGKRIHQVRIYWDPANTIDINKVDEVQNQGDARGGFDPKTLTTFLHKEADISTFFHETAHFMLTVTEDLVLSGQATPDIQKDFEVLLDFWGVESVDAWRNLSFDEKRKHHEAFAYNYEVYLMEEKAAPSVELQDVFTRFGNFVRNVYRSITELNKLYRDENGTDLPVLTDDVRAVMDRMVASEDQITYSQRVYEMRPMFETQEQSNMDDATWQEYRDAIEKAKDEAIDTLNKSSLKEISLLDTKGKSLQKLQDKEIRETRKRIKEEETVKAENETLYKLERFLKKGEWNDKDDNPFKSAGTHKLDIESIRNLVPSHDMKSEIKALGTGKWGMVGKNGLPVEMVAELFGFETAGEMIDGLIALDPIKEVIKERTDERMISEFSDLTDPKERELKVQQALNNKARAKFLAIELKFLTKSTQPVRMQVAAARQVAKSILRKTRIKDIRPVKYAQNQKRAIKDLEKAMRTGDDRGAIEAKRSELINSQLNREATNILEEYNKAVKRYKNLFKRSDEKIGKARYRTVDYVNAAQEILSHYGLGPQLEEGTSFVDNLKKYDEHIWEEVRDIISDTQRLPGRELKDLTLQDFNTLDEVIESLLYQARRDMQFKVEGELREREEVSGELVTALNNMDARASIAYGEAGQTKWWERMISGLEGLKAMLRRVEHWCDSKDGEVGIHAGDKSYAREIRGGGLLGGGVLVKKEGEAAGPFTRYIWRTLKDPINKWRSERPKWTGRYVDLLERVDWSQIKISAPELVNKKGIHYVFGRERGMGKAELLGAMLHTGNKGNLTKLLVGREWGEIREDGTLDSSKWDRFVDRMIEEGHITEKDLQFLQDVWDLNEELLPLTQRAHKDVFGYYFKTIEVTPLVTKFGTFRGGYVPAVADPEMSKRKLSLDEEIKLIKDEMKYAAPAVERGFTKPRTQAMRPLSLNLGLQAAHLDNALRFAYIQPAITDLLRLFRDKKFADALNRVDDHAMKNMFMPWLRNAASQKTTLGNNTLLDKATTRMTKSTSLNYMFFSLKNGMQQLTGKLPARLKIEHKYLNDAFRRYTREPHKVAKEVAEMSPFMRDRQINQMFDVQDTMNDLILNPQKYEKFQKWVAKNAYFVQQAFQNYVDSVVWIAKYNQVLTNAPKTMTEAQIHAEAIQQADGAVRMTQDSLLPEDVAAYQINHPFYKAVFQFTSYFNAQANLNATQYKALIKELGWNSKQFSGQILFAFLFGFVLPALVSEGIQELATGGLADEDEDGYIDEFFEFGYMSLFRYGSAFIPTGSSFLMVPLNMLDDKPYNDRITISPSISLINSTMQGTTRMLVNLATGKEVKGNEVRSVITLMGLIGNLPLYPFAKSIGLLHDLKDGRWVPHGPVDLIRGLVTGQAGEGRRK